MGYLYLGIAIVGELIGTNLLKASNGFARWGLGIGSLAAYMACFYFLSLTMKTVDLNVTYALWAGLGIVATTILSVWLWHEPISWVSLLGIALIVCGTVLLNLKA